MRVLVVEDDDLVREMAVMSLTDEGFEVIEAATAEEGLDHCAEHAADVLFTDIRLPGLLSGWDVAERCRESNPSIPVVYATGFSSAPPRPVPGGVMLYKPYLPAQVVAVIRSVAAAQ
jgi:CheY-like chemotaxis protein